MSDYGFLIDEISQYHQLYFNEIHLDTKRRLKDIILNLVIELYKADIDPIV